MTEWRPRKYDPAALPRLDSDPWFKGPRMGRQGNGYEAVKYAKACVRCAPEALASAPQPPERAATEPEIQALQDRVADHRPGEPAAPR